MGGTVTLFGAASLTGYLGEDHPEQFDSKQVTVTPAGADAVRLREVVDIDFADTDRHGYERVIPNDFGAPTDVTASSPDAPDALDVVDRGSETQIRIGDADTTVNGQHRYVLEYTLPEVQLDSDGRVPLDIIGNDETLRTERFEIVLAGWELSAPVCNVGSEGDSGGCAFSESADGTYRAVIEPLDAGDGITIGFVDEGTGPPVEVAEPDEPAPYEHPQRLLRSIIYMLLGGGAAGGVYLWFRRLGSNTVAAGGAADAAFAGAGGPGFAPPAPPWAATAAPSADSMPPPPPASSPLPESQLAGGQQFGTRRVSDAQLADLATTEFAPPRGMEPWVGNVLLNEKITSHTVAAWFSGLAARGWIDISGEGKEPSITKTDTYADAPGPVRDVLDKMFKNSDSITLGKYSKSFASAWKAVPDLVRDEINTRNYWTKPVRSSLGGGAGGLRGAAPARTVIWIVIFMVWFGGFNLLRFAGKGPDSTGRPGLLANPVTAGLIALVVPAIVAAVVYWRMLPSRTAAGSAAALQVESFRRFLAASEGQHVEWAWQQGLLREYSAWAVALDAADAWEKAMLASGVPQVERTHGPMVLYIHSSSFQSSYTSPSSRGGGGGGTFGGGFSGGSVGGGGGGGSSGSW